VRLAIYGLFFILAGCAYPKKSDLFKSPERASGKSVLYLYRTKTSIDSLNPDVPTFYINDEKIGKLSLGGYYRIEVKPGPFIVSYRTSLFGIPLFKSPQELKVTAETDQIYYVKFSIESVMRQTELDLVPPSTGETEIKSTRLLVN
jgi:hypothetical protein